MLGIMFTKIGKTRRQVRRFMWRKKIVLLASIASKWVTCQIIVPIELSRRKINISKKRCSMRTRISKTWMHGTSQFRIRINHLLSHILVKTKAILTLIDLLQEEEIGQKWEMQQNAINATRKVIWQRIARLKV